MCCAQEREGLGLTPALNFSSCGSPPPVALLLLEASLQICPAIPCLVKKHQRTSSNFSFERLWGCRSPGAKQTDGDRPASLGIRGVLTAWDLCVGSPRCWDRCKALCGPLSVTFPQLAALDEEGPSCYLAPSFCLPWWAEQH